MTNIRRALEAAAAVGGDATYVEDVFNITVYEGNGSADRGIVTGIDLLGEGGMVWTKCRTQAYSHDVTDTIIGPSQYIEPNKGEGDQGGLNYVAFNNDGHDVDIVASTNENGEDFVVWTFRKAPGLFDVVTWTGTGSAKTVSHALGSVPGCIMVKQTSSSGDDWAVYHRGNTANPETEYLILNTTAATADDSAWWNDTAPTSAVFTVGTDGSVNATGETYIAYVFAHDDESFGADSDESIIKCGGFSHTNGTQDEIDLGWEAHWVLLKASSGSGGTWYLLDSLRGWDYTTDDMRLGADTSAAESGANLGHPTAQGFSFESSQNTKDYIYIAIRRPMKVPEAGTEVYKGNTRTGTGSAASITGAGFVVDMVWTHSLSGTTGGRLENRLRGATKELITESTAIETTVVQSVTGFDVMAGFDLGDDADWNTNTATYIDQMFSRASECMDMLVVSASDPATANAHNLGVVPEFSIIKRVNAHSFNRWSVGTNFQATTLTTKYMDEPGVYGGVDAPYVHGWNLINALPTATHFTMIATTAGPFLCFLFATLAGVSKVGSYTADATLTTIDCGFAAGARFILITRTDAAGEWYIYDSARGIVAGNDPYYLNTASAEVTGTDYIDPENSGFQLTAAGSGTINIDTATYIFLAIA